MDENIINHVIVISIYVSNRQMKCKFLLGFQVNEILFS